MLELALPPLTIWVDNMIVVDRWGWGKTWCCSSSRPVADLWKRFWRLMEDIGEGVLLRKCKGHATGADIERGRATEFTKQGNDSADNFAGRECEIAECSSASDAEREAFQETKRWYAWLAVLCSHRPKDVQAVDPQQACGTSHSSSSASPLTRNINIASL